MWAWQPLAPATVALGTTGSALAKPQIIMLMLITTPVFF